MTWIYRDQDKKDKLNNCKSTTTTLMKLVKKKPRTTKRMRNVS